MQEHVYNKTLVGDVSELRQRLIDCWSSLSQNIIDDAIDQWQVRLRECVKAKGCHFWAFSALKPAVFRATHDFQKKHALFSVCSLRDDNVITSKFTWKLKHTNSILEYSEYFCQISSKLLLVILSYTVLKLRRFFETQCRVSIISSFTPIFVHIMFKCSISQLLYIIIYADDYVLFVHHQTFYFGIYTYSCSPRKIFHLSWHLLSWSGLRSTTRYPYGVLVPWS